MPNRKMTAQAGPGICRRCGCTDYNACYPPCFWVEEDLCSGCITKRERQELLNRLVRIIHRKGVAARMMSKIF